MPKGYNENVISESVNSLFSPPSRLGKMNRLYVLKTNGAKCTANYFLFIQQPVKMFRNSL